MHRPKFSDESRWSLLADDGDPFAIAADPAVLGAIRRPTVALSIWTRPPPLSIEPAGLTGFTPIRIETGISTARAALARTFAVSPKRAWHLPLISDVTELAARFAALMDLDDVDIRIERVTGNSCWKFHADYVRARLITTYCGRGTEWAVRDGETLGETRRMEAGDVSIFKGRIWLPDPPVLHRSPPIAQTEEVRLLLVIDPLPKC